MSAVATTFLVGNFSGASKRYGDPADSAGQKQMLRDFRGDGNNPEMKMHYTETLLLLSPLTKKNLSATAFESSSNDNVKLYTSFCF